MSGTAHGLGRKGESLSIARGVRQLACVSCDEDPHGNLEFRLPAQRERVSRLISSDVG